MKSWKEKIKKVTSKAVSGGGGGGSTAWTDLIGYPTDNNDFNGLYQGLLQTDSDQQDDIEDLEEIVEGRIEDLSTLALSTGQLLYQAVGGSLAALSLGTGLSITAGVLNASGGGSGGAEELNDLSDVQLSSPLLNQILRYDGDFWENYNLTLSLFEEINMEGIENEQALIWDEADSEFIPAWVALTQEPVNLLSGSVASDGSSSGEGWTISKMGTGDYRINFSPPLVTPPAVIVEINHTSAGTFYLTQTHSVSNSSARVLIATAAADLTDSGFSFIAVASRIEEMLYM